MRIPSKPSHLGVLFLGANFLSAWRQISQTSSRLWDSLGELGNNRKTVTYPRNNEDFMGFIAD